MAAAFWGFTAVAGQSETRRVDARLGAGLRAALATYDERLDYAQSEATSLARSRDFQAELARRNLPAILFTLRDVDDVAIRGANGFKFGKVPVLAATRTVEVFDATRLLGTVTVSVPYDSTLIATLRESSGLGPTDSLAVLRNGRVIAS